ncbi:excinuclease ABC subunit UvrA [Candidatus Anaplasma sp. TIGMIC]|uniref:excinuclease ABC subunit UvrA n=1 Tax=Candidatus Anaplasma sp. TIGMIC TaxID=3020713 RepID=UPI00232E42B1|nr:excinuclease ABC subunit UvrA [Candidatus Anaplasma sp. TIGMIC]MDB1135614.1 excinuclease ABC subunit UvrA [Candidatus Anaplasma sp. TIGMIC]
MAKGVISIRGARVHNLKSVDVDLPKNKLIVITGVSGSGKSSLAFDTLYAEGQRRYVESLSSYTRQFMNLHAKPDVDSIEGLSPAISVSQKSTSKNPRSTVSTVTEIHDYLRLMFARIGVPYSPKTKRPIIKMSASRIAHEIACLPVGCKVHLLGPIANVRPTEYSKKISAIRKQGYARISVDRVVYDINAIPSLEHNRKYDIAIVVDRLSITGEKSNRISNSVENALAIGNGVMQAEIVALPEGYTDDKYAVGQILAFSEHFICTDSGFSVGVLEPKLFSFNTVTSACQFCLGLGKSRTIDANLVVPDVELSILEGAIDPVGPLKSLCYSSHESVFMQKCRSEITALAKRCACDISQPWRSLDVRFRNLVLYGNEEGKLNSGNSGGFRGIVGLLSETGNTVVERIAERYSTSSKCSHCNGYRLSPQALSVKIDNLHMGEVCAMTVVEAIDWCRALPARLTEFENAVCSRLLEEVIRRLTFLRNVGLGYLTLDRESRTLSGGESQRIKLASHIGSSLTGVLYVLDEPSIGLHQRDNALLIETLNNLKDMENTVVVIEHDEETIVRADYIVDVGPGAGIHGGEIVAQGSLDDVLANPQSITGKYLSGQLRIPISEGKKVFSNWIKIKGARKNNLRNVDVEIPIGGFTCITGVSGSGKSSLISDILYPYALSKIYGVTPPPEECAAIFGLENIDKVIEIDQSPIGRTPASNPATYVGLFSHIRSWFAGLPLSKSRGYTMSRFSFNAKGGRCEACKGDMYVKIEMHFLPDMYVKCEECNGLRYNQETLEVTYKGKSIADVLEMTVDQALDLFASIPLIREKLESLQSVGMGYIKIGQPSTTLSGGESQRIKMSKELSKRSTGNTLYILDEPTTGLHISDIHNLLEILHRLSDMGNTVVVIEHNLHVIKTSDYIIDIGPEGGVNGGQVVGCGTPQELVRNYPHSSTAQYLAPYLQEQVIRQHKL